jgi:hypothetical protein
VIGEDAGSVEQFLRMHAEIGTPKTVAGIRDTVE